MTDGFIVGQDAERPQNIVRWNNVLRAMDHLKNVIETIDSRVPDQVSTVIAPTVPAIGTSKFNLTDMERTSSNLTFTNVAGDEQVLFYNHSATDKLLFAPFISVVKTVDLDTDNGILLNISYESRDIVIGGPGAVPMADVGDHFCLRNVLLPPKCTIELRSIQQSQSTFNVSMLHCDLEIGEPPPCYS